MAKMMKIIALSAFWATAIIGSTAQPTYEVLDSQGWTIPPNGSAAYTAWASGKTFTVGDTLVFNYPSGMHDVTEVTKEAYDNCDAMNPISTHTDGPTSIRLDSVGGHYFICSINSHCSFGQKLAINVNSAPRSPPAPAPVSTISHPPASVPVPSTDVSPAPASGFTISYSPESAPAPAISSTPLGTTAPAPETTTDAPSRTPMTYIVGDGIGWTVPPGGSSAYQTWANDKTFMVGDILEFDYVIGSHDVAEVTKADYDSCNSSSTLTLEENSPARITLTSAGDHYFICAMPQHCFLGQKLAITVSGDSTSLPSSGGYLTSPPPAESTNHPAGSSATSLTATAWLSTVILSLAIALLF